MIEKLRHKLIFVIMAMVTVTLVLMSGIIIAVNYNQSENDLVATVQYATSDNAFQRHDNTSEIAPPVDSQGQSANGDTQSAADGGGSDATPTPAQNATGAGKFDNKGAGTIATSCYLVSSDGAVTSTLSDALELDTAALDQAVSYALSQDGATGEIGTSGKIADQGLRYSIRNTPSGIKVAFVSDGYIANTVGRIALELGIVCLCVWLAFLGISIFLARWLLRPTEQAWAQQQQFVADASHELKTPLTVIMANNSILLSHEDETIASQRRWVESSQTEAHQMLGLVNDMLFLAKPQDQTQQAIKESVNFSDLLEGNILQFEAVCYEKDISLEDEVARGIVLNGDKNRLQRLVSTLLDNACKYADKGGRVKVTLAKVGSKAVFSVNNDGTIIPPEDIPYIFDRFYRVDKSRVRSEGGVGLGLAIAKEVVEEHAGTIAVTSSDEGGTTFTATFPLESADAK